MSLKRTITVLALLLVPALCLWRAVAFRLDSVGPLDILIVDNKNYNERGLYPEMVAAYEQLVKRYPERTDLLYPLGWAYYKTGRVQEGYACMYRYAQSNPFYPEWQRYYIHRVRKAAEHALQ